MKNPDVVQIDLLYLPFIPGEHIIFSSPSGSSFRTGSDSHLTNGSLSLESKDLQGVVQEKSRISIGCEWYHQMLARDRYQVECSWSSFRSWLGWLSHVNLVIYEEASSLFGRVFSDDTRPNDLDLTRPPWMDTSLTMIENGSLEISSRILITFLASLYFYFAQP